MATRTPTRGQTPEFLRAIQHRDALSASLVTLAVLQAVWFAASTSGSLYRVVAVGLGMASVIAFLVLRTSERRPVVLGLLAVTAFLNIAISFLSFRGVVESRLLLVGVVFGYLAVAMAWAVSRRTSLSYSRAIPSTLVAALLLLFIESVVAPPVYVEPPADTRHRVPQPQGTTYAPNTHTVSEYPENPRGYFSTTDQFRAEWFLSSNDSLHTGELIRPDDDPELLRVRVDRGGGREAWRLKIEQRRLPLTQGESYRLSFKARSTAPRPLSYLIWGSAPGQPDVGLNYRSIELDTAWRGWSETFRATVNDQNATLLFELGTDTADVELTSVELTDEATGIRVREGAIGRFAVSFRFDSLGCRGPEYPLQRAPSTVRILALGDSRTLGAGVHEIDTFSARLERLLNEGRDSLTSVRHEVINCGIAGYGVEDAQRLYQTLGRRLRPDIVLLAITPGDERSGDFESSVGRGSHYSSFEYLFATLAKFRDWRSGDDPQHNAERIMAVVRSIHDSVRNDSAKMAVMVFEDGSTGAGRTLERIALGVVRDSVLPVLGLGSHLRVFTRRDLVVHEELDQSPNNVAHGIAATELHRFLRSEGLLAWAEQLHTRARATVDSSRARGAARGRSGRR